jgi:hypothetical protein
MEENLLNLGTVLRGWLADFGTKVASIENVDWKHFWGNFYRNGRIFPCL